MRSSTACSPSPWPPATTGRPGTPPRAAATSGWRGCSPRAWGRCSSSWTTSPRARPPPSCSLPPPTARSVSSPWPCSPVLVLADLDPAPELLGRQLSRLARVEVLLAGADQHRAGGTRLGDEDAHGDEVDRHRHELVGGQSFEASPFAGQGCDHRRPDVGHDRVRGAVVGRPVHRKPEAPRRGRQGALHTGREREGRGRRRGADRGRSRPRGARCRGSARRALACGGYREAVVEVPGEALELELGALSGLLGLALELEDLLLDGLELVALRGNDALLMRGEARRPLLALAVPFHAGLEPGAGAARGCLPRPKSEGVATPGQGPRGQDEDGPVAGQVVAAGGLRPAEHDAGGGPADLTHGPV